MKIHENKETAQKALNNYTKAIEELSDKFSCWDSCEDSCLEVYTETEYYDENGNVKKLIKY